MNMSDADLLASYVRDGSEAAFAELVGRYLNLVYSVARRQARSAATAEDVTQAVFIELAREAHRIKPGTPLIAWLHLVSRRIAANAVREEVRRQARETEAARLATLMKTNPSGWPAIEPLLDEAVGALGEADRTAILLRYMASKSLREVGAALGVSDDAAQKRVSRALDELRRFLLKRGVGVTAAGLASDLSAHAIVIAPAGLGVAALSGATAASAAAGALAAAGTTSVVTMTAFSKILLISGGVVLAGAGLYQASLYARQQSTLETLRIEADDLSGQLGLIRAQQRTTSGQLKAVESDIDARLARAQAAQAADAAALEATANRWIRSLAGMKQLLKERPAQSIPELALLTDDDWQDLANIAYLDSEYGIRQTLAEVRRRAEQVMAGKIMKALADHAAVSGGAAPADVRELAPYLEPDVDPAWLARYEMGHSVPGKATATPGGSTVTVRTLVDFDYDTWWDISATGFSSTNAMHYNVTQARDGYAAANNGGHVSTSAELIPYLKWPVDEAAVKLWIHPPYQPRR